MNLRALTFDMDGSWPTPKRPTGEPSMPRSRMLSSLHSRGVLDRLEAAR
jgi:hypothetical protein